ncbi:glycosyltransferase family 4 protein [Xanthomarina spongicola]|uniref:Glycosyltransferase involved in cell wall biosynthesis n=1 Tax=Xanthomarina spongicola TaxID=570520 RepID=A0A316DLK8_9FLAO|nr:glycosyltransferase family 4 protein [Xanthomarina spongicola]PWK18606.1 glycosyltransferase involved in cell wall biosynthesis [Xanthomarina spongicola]
MKNVLYIGNNLKQRTANISAIRTLGAKLEKEGFNLVYASSKANKVYRLFDMLSSCFRHRKTTDVVLIDTYSTQNFYYAFCVSLVCSFLGLKYIPILHGGNLPMRLKMNPKLCQVIFKPAYKLVSPSIYLKEAFEASGYQNVDYIPNSLEMDQYVFHIKELQKVDLLWVRSFSTIYNPLLAVKILKELQDDNIQASLCMVGPDADGSMETVKQLANELNVSIKITGKLPKKEWLALAKDYNIFINTTNFDNMPVSVIEAMALGLPVISTNVGGLPYLITHEKDGLLVPPNNVDTFVVAIKQLLNNPVATNTLAFNARQKVEQFDWNVIKYKWVELLS